MGATDTIVRFLAVGKPGLGVASSICHAPPAGCAHRLRMLGLRLHQVNRCAGHTICGRRS